MLFLFSQSIETVINDLLDKQKGKLSVQRKLDRPFARMILLQLLGKGRNCFRLWIQPDVLGKSRDAYDIPEPGKNEHGHPPLDHFLDRQNPRVYQIPDA